MKESSGRLPQIADLVRVLPRGFKVFSGDDNLALASIGVGAHGLVSVAANEIPAEMGRMIRAALNGNGAEAREIERRYARLIDANFWDSNPTPVKTVLSLMGRCADFVRLPLVPPSAATRVRSGWPENSACSSICLRRMARRRCFDNRGQGSEIR